MKNKIVLIIICLLNVTGVSVFAEDINNNESIVQKKKVWEIQNSESIDHSNYSTR